MNEEISLLKETARRIFEDHVSPALIESAEAGTVPLALWETLEGAGLTLAGIAESAGGVGGAPSYALTALSEAGHAAAPVPLLQTWLAARMLELSGQQAPAGMLAVAAGDFRRQGTAIVGSAPAVSYADWCDQLVVIGPGLVALLPASALTITPGQNLAGEPRSAVAVAGEPVSVAAAELDASYMIHGAIGRSCMIAGALEYMLAAGVNYALERTQFGRSIAKFQAIQHQLAVLAGEVAVARRAADMAMAALDDGDYNVLGAAAKARAGEAVGICADIAHQVHGAMGYTREHPLNLRSRRVWAWRDDFGNERWWNEKVGEWALADGADGLWPRITAL